MEKTDSEKNRIPLKIMEQFYKTENKYVPRRFFIDVEFRNAENNEFIRRFLAKGKTEIFHLINGEKITYRTFLNSTNQWIEETEQKEIIKENEEKIPLKNCIHVIPLIERKLDERKRKHHATKIELTYILLDDRELTFPFFPEDIVCQEIFW